jgi:MFS transporter, DHA1 family, multidrug/chloramphenicol efflux transport protein
LEYTFSIQNIENDMLSHLKKSTTAFVAFLLLFEFSVYIANDMIMPGMIQIVKEFSVSDKYIPSSLSAFILGGASLQILLGPLSDRYGRRKIMLFGVSFFLLGSTANGLSTSIGQFMLARFFQGMGVCYIGVIGYAAIQEMFEEKKAVKIISIMTTISILAPLLGPLGGSIFLEYYHWRGINVIIAAFALVSLIGLYFYFPDKTQLKIVKNIEYKNNDAVKERKNIFKESIHNYSFIIKNKKFMFGVVAFACIELPLIVWIAISPIVLVRKAGLTQFEYGFYQFPVFGGFIIGVFFLQKLLKSNSLEKIVIKGSVLSGIGLLLSFLLPILFQEHFLSVVIPYSIYAIGLGIISSPIYRLVLFSSSVSKGSVAAAFSLMTMLVFGIGTESMAFIYKNQSNIALGGFGFIIFIIYLASIRFFVNVNQNNEVISEEKAVSGQK